MKRIWLVAFCYWTVASALICLLYPCMISDTMVRYAPMADAFARGDLELAFHPRFGVLFQCLAGSIAWLTGLPGDCACQVVATSFLSLSAVSVWFLVRELFGERVAWYAVAAVLVCDDFTRYAMDGLRDVGKCLAFALLGLGAVKERSGWFSLGLLVFSTLVSYGFAVSVALAFGWCAYYGGFRRDWRKCVLPLVAVVLGSTAVIIMVHHYTGHWVPAPHYIKVVGRWL